MSPPAAAKGVSAASWRRVEGHGATWSGSCATAGDAGAKAAVRAVGAAAAPCRDSRGRHRLRPHRLRRARRHGVLCARLHDCRDPLLCRTGRSDPVPLSRPAAVAHGRADPVPLSQPTQATARPRASRSTPRASRTATPHLRARRSRTPRRRATPCVVARAPEPLTLRRGRCSWQLPAAWAAST